jgi:hypothetical protein
MNFKKADFILPKILFFYLNSLHYGILRNNLAIAGTVGYLHIQANGCSRLTLPTVKVRSALSHYSYCPCRAHNQEESAHHQAYSKSREYILLCLKLI